MGRGAPPIAYRSLIMSEPSQEKLTPMLKQYLDLKSRYADALMLFQMGDFYEMFFEDARKGAEALNIALTSRSRQGEERIPMAGFPIHAAQAYIARLLDAGFQVVVCDQTEDPALAKGLVRREVTRIITQGTVVDPASLDARTDNYLAAAAFQGQKWGLAYLELSTGEFRLTEGEGPDSLADELWRLKPAEILMSEDYQGNVLDAALAPFGAPPPRRRLTPFAFDPDAARRELGRALGTLFLDGFGLEIYHLGVAAAGAIIRYLRDSHTPRLPHLDRLLPYRRDDYLELDEATLRNLEIFETWRTRSRQGSLLEVLDATVTPMGGRRLGQWLRYPLIDPEAIEARLDGVEFFKENSLLRQRWRDTLKGLGDLERLTARVALEQASPREVAAVKHALARVPGLKALLPDQLPPLVGETAADLDGLPDIHDLIDRALVDDPPANLQAGGVFREGFDPELDELISFSREGKDWIARLEAEERVRTGINSLKVGYNKIFGYYLEVSRANLQHVPPDYIRKQTLVNAERFITAALKDYETRVLGADDARVRREAALFQDLRRRLGEQAPRLKKVARALAVLDVLAALAQTAALHRYCRPRITPEPLLEIRQGRHPVIERILPPGAFVPNDITLSGDSQVLIVTGPNMSGKSTILRQVALTALLAHVGSFVPAQAARVGLTDRIFTRVGAVDDIGRGQSTFLVEMHETARILHQASPRSLVILDEIGRGTSTFDGLALAWAVAEHLHDLDGRGVKTLFATHYQELTELSRLKPRVQNFQVLVTESEGNIVFLHRLQPGAASKSYGIQVARLAGVPPEVIDRAGEVLENLEAGTLDPTGLPRLARRRRRPGPESPQLRLFQNPEKPDK
ncbi:MAG: DNA mismatch repair protein MutS [Deltaproteobacteria bacterium]|nr:DNA mismatch repair protein MutS [Deltaproteobacteria bacterium]